MTDNRDTKRNASIAGSGRFTGGVYGHVEIAGSGTVSRAIWRLKKLSFRVLVTWRGMSKQRSSGPPAPAR